MHPRVSLPAAALLVAALARIGTQLPTVLLLSSEGTPSPRAMAAYSLGGRFVAFALVFGLLLYLAYRVGAGATAEGDGTELALLTGGTATLGALAVIAVLFISSEPSSAVLGALGTLGTSLATGVRVAVVTFAGLALVGRGG